jgi:cytochrome P450
VSSRSVDAPGPPRRYPLQNWLALQRNPLRFLEGVARHGDVARFRLGPVFVYLVNDPDLIRSVLVTRADAYHKGRALERARRLLGQGLLTSEGALHLRQRRLMQPAFHRERIAGYGETMVRYAGRAAERWKAGETIDVHK